MAERYPCSNLGSPRFFNWTHRGLRVGRGRGLSHRRYRGLLRLQKVLGVAILLLGILLVATASAKAEETRVLVVLAAPRDLATPRGPVEVHPWHGENGARWYSGVLAPALERYVERVTYGRVALRVDVTPWLALPETRGVYAESRNLQMWRAVEAASQGRGVSAYDVVVVLDPTSPYDANYSSDWDRAPGWGWFQPGCYQTPGEKKRVDCIFTGTFYTGNGHVKSPGEVLVKILAHELAHALDFRANGRYTLLDNQGEEYSLMGRAYAGEPLLDPANEELLLGSRGTPAEEGRGFRLEPRETGAGKFLTISGTRGHYYAEYRRELVEGLRGYSQPGLLLWSLQGDRLQLDAVVRGAGEHTLEPGKVLRVLEFDGESVRGQIVTA
ncbi:MAG: hypothetical protein HY558_00935 [Euryarchaeota archaeon]|nr:hypothetical protein [Euryarchaeota archaeon]